MIQYYVWYNAKADLIVAVKEDTSLILQGLAFTCPHIVYLGEL